MAGIHSGAHQAFKKQQIKQGYTDTRVQRYELFPQGEETEEEETKGKDCA